MPARQCQEPNAAFGLDENRSRTYNQRLLNNISAAVNSSIPDVVADPPALTCYSPESETGAGENQEVDIDPSRPRAHAREGTRTKLGRPEQQAAPFETERFAYSMH